jgi:hypothetical protein
MILLVAVLALQGGVSSQPEAMTQRPGNECDESLLIRTPLFLINHVGDTSNIKTVGSRGFFFFIQSTPSDLAITSWPRFSS